MAGKVDEDFLAEEIVAVPRWVAITGVIGFALTLLIYVLRLDRVVGLTIDDAWYVLLAKSLATGQGFTLINSPTPGILPLYPPGFPFLLSLFYRLLPNFPDNVWLLKSVSIAAMIGVGWLAFIYFCRDRMLPASIALGIALATMLCPPLTFLATSTVMSECVFTFILIVVVVVVERSVKADRDGSGKAWLYVVAAAALSSYAFLTRAIAVALIGAIFLYFLKERLVRAALILTAVVALLTGPWVLYTRAHTPAPAQQKEQGGHIVQPYTTQFWQRVASDTMSGTVTAGELPSRIWNNVLEISGRDVLRVVAAPLFELLIDPYKEAQKLSARGATDQTEDTLIVSFIFSLFVVIGFVSVAREKITLAEIAIPAMLVITVLWPWETIRFVLPLTPFILFYFLMGIRALSRLVRSSAPAKAGWAVPAIVIALIVAFNLFGNVFYVVSKLTASELDRPQWLQSFDDAEKMFKWVSQSVPQNETIVTLNPPLVALYTDRKTVAWEKPVEKWELWKQLGVRHLVWFAAYPVQPEPEQQAYPAVYRARNILDFRVTDLGPVESRADWGK